MKDFVRAGHQFGIDVVAEIVDKGRSVSVTTDGACIGNRLKELRESKELSQGDIEKRSGLLRCYISRVENGHTIPSVETLEKMVRAVEVPLYRLFHDGEAPASLRKLTNSEAQSGKPITSPNWAGYLRKWNLTTKNCCCTWLKKSPEASPEPFQPESLKAWPEPSILIDFDVIEL